MVEPGVMQIERRPSSPEFTAATIYSVVRSALLGYQAILRVLGHDDDPRSTAILEELESLQEAER